MGKLKRCPFCGGVAGLYHGDSTDGYIKGTDYFEAFCGLCGARIRKFKREEAIEAWNNRPNPWRTGTPTDDGWYVCKLRDSDLFETHYFTNNNWDEKLFEKWQKIVEE